MKLLLETAVTAGMGGAITQDTLSSALNQAAAAGHLQVLHMLLDVGMPLAELLPEAFSSAAFGGRLKAARLLLSRMLPAGQWEEGYRGKFTQRSLLYYNHPLVTAASSGRTGIVQLVIDSGGSFSSNVLTAALMNATRYEYLPVMQLLLETGADVNGGQGTSYHESPLYEAVSSQRWAAAEVLLQKGAHVGSPALMHAINTYAPPCAYHVLLCYACDKDNQALFAAAFRRQHEVVDALLAAGGTPTSIEALAGRYEAALCGAASAHHLALVKSLLESANKKLREQPAGPALLKHLLNKPLQAAIAGLQYALEQLCARDDGQEGRMSQHLLQSEREAMKYSRARRDDTTIVRLLLEQGADPDHEEGRPLVMAVRQHRADMVRLLFAAGAVKTEQAVKAAAEAGYDDLVGQLLHHIQGSS
jgi:ankyrin repeat protein